MIVTRDPGYVLDVDPEAVDAIRFERMLRETRALPAAERAERLREALALWQGPAVADVAGTLPDVAERLDELRLSAHEELLDAELQLGHHLDAVAELEALVRAEPTRERGVAQLMLALYRSGRQADALEAYRRFRQVLNTTLGLEPTHGVRELERQILLQDPALAPPATGRPERHRRLPLTVVALEFEADETDPEAYADTAARAQEVIRLVFERHGAAVQRAGSTVLGLFGAPTPHEDDAARALGAARAALDGIGGRGRAGVASGDSFRGESVAIEQALRLRAGAASGVLEVDAATRSRARLRGLRPDRPLTGRATEQRRLRRLHDAVVRERAGALAVLVGPAGIGKSRLAEDLVAWSAPMTRIVRTRCLSYGDGIGMLPATELVRAAAGLAPEATPEEARARLSRLLGDDDLAAAGVAQLVGVLGLSEEPPDASAAWAVRRLLEAAAEQAPTLVLVEDIHWATPAFLEVVERLAEPASAALLVVATARELPTERLRGAAIELAPLAFEACAEIVGELLGGEVVGASEELLIERSGGNPLFLEELVHDLRASGRLDEAPPPSLRSLLAARVERLPERERDLLTRCSVLGRAFTLAELGHVAEDVEGPLAALVAAGLLEPAAAADDLQFRHILIRDAAYASLPLALKAELHERVAALYDSSPVGGGREHEALAVHHLDEAYRARPGDPRLRAELASRAAALGHALLARGDAVAASSLLARAVELEPENGSRAVIELGRARFDLGDLAGADEAFARAERGPLAERATVGRIEVRLHTDPDCDLEGAGAAIDRLLVALRGREDDGVVEALLARAYVSLTRGRVGELSATLDEALHVAQTTGRSRAEAEILFLVCGTSWYGPTPVAEGTGRCERVLAEARDRPIVEAAALQALAVLHAMVGRYERARESVAAARSLKRGIGQELGAAASALDEGMVELLAGRHAAAERVLRSGSAELDRLGEKGYFSTLTALLARAVAAQGRADEARELARAAAAAAAPDDVASHVTWRAAEAHALARLGEDEAAQHLAREAVALADATDFPLLRADAWAAHGDVGRAVEILEQKGLSAAAIDAWVG